MKILIVNRFFGGAQIPTGRMAEDVGRLLAAEGHEVTALASSGAYEGAEKQPKHGAWSREQGVLAQAQDQEAQAQHGAGSIEQGQAEQKPEGRGRQSGALRVETVHVPKWMPRALAWLWFTWRARKQIPKMDWDVCVLMTDPPLLPLLAAKAARDEWRVTSDECVDPNQTPKNGNTERPPRRATRRVAVWLMDLYPEALAASGRLRVTNPIYHWYFNKRQRALGASDLLIFLGEMQKALVEKCEGRKLGRLEGADRQPEHGAERIEQTKLQTRTAVVPPWDDRGNIALATDESLQNLALYAGNLGEAHCFEEILSAALFLPADWRIRFAVRGAKAGALRDKAKGISHGIFSHGLTRMDTDESDRHAPAGLRGNAHSGGPPVLAVSPPDQLEARKDQKTKRSGAEVEITGYASEEETPKLLAAARVHLITMSPGWEGIVVPSKLYGCIRTGRPVLFIGPENADTAREILRNDWGTVLPPGASGEKVAAAILELAARATKLPPEQHGAAQVAELVQSLATD